MIRELMREREIPEFGGRVNFAIHIQSLVVGGKLEKGLNYDIN